MENHLPRGVGTHQSRSVGVRWNGRLQGSGGVDATGFPRETGAHHRRSGLGKRHRQMRRDDVALRRTDGRARPSDRFQCEHERLLPVHAEMPTRGLDVRRDVRRRRDDGVRHRRRPRGAGRSRRRQHDRRVRNAVRDALEGPHGAHDGQGGYRHEDPRPVGGAPETVGPRYGTREDDLRQGPHREARRSRARWW